MDILRGVTFDRRDVPFRLIKTSMQDTEHHSYSAPTEEHLDTFRRFISTQNQELRSLESALEDSSTDVGGMRLNADLG